MSQRQRRSLTPEERERRSRDAKRLVAEGKIGGFQPKKIRVEAEENPPVRAEEDLFAALVAETNMDDVQDLIIGAMVDALTSAKSSGEKLRAAQMFLDAAHKHKKLQLEERRELERADQTRILGGILQQLGGEPGDAEEILDADFSEDVEERQSEGPGDLRELEAGQRPDDA